MKINNNISAVISNKHLLRNEESLTIHMEKLSSGFKINHAGDDPSGMAISSKMRAQIRGLDQASDNASDGMSVLETADGALNEVTEMIQRMRELSVQAANGTNSESDRKAIQEEISDLREEIDRISESTEFNTKKLLDGSLDKRIYTEGISRVAISDEVPAGRYDFEISQLPTKAELTPDPEVSWNDLPSKLDAAMEAADASEAVININGSGTKLTKGMSIQDIYTALRKTAELGEASIGDYDDGNGAFSIQSLGYGDEASLEIQMDPWFADALGITLVEVADPDGTDILSDPGDPSVITKTTKAYAEITPGTNAIIEMDKTTSNFGKQATYTTYTKLSGISASRSVDGRRIAMTDVGGFEIDFLIDETLLDKYEPITKIQKNITNLEKSNEKLTSEVNDWTTTSDRLTRLNADDGIDITVSNIENVITAVQDKIDNAADEDEKAQWETTLTRLNELDKRKGSLSGSQSLADIAAEKAAEAQTTITENNTKISDYTTSLDQLKTDLKYANDYEIEVSDIGPMNLQIGANEGQQMTVRIDSMSSVKMYLDQIDVTSQRGATRALEQLDEALSMVSSTRSNIGAYTNRLEHAVKSLDQTSENMNQAISRIQDADIAEEMTEYTKYNVLQQASTSALSQANELPQTALQLLQ